MHGTKLDDEQVLCIKKGVVPVEGKCRKFSYDPCKRIPPKQKALDFSKYEQEDYSLWKESPASNKVMQDFCYIS